MSLDQPYSFYNYVDMTRQAIEHNIYPTQRVGQIYFNILHRIHPTLANQIRATKLDPFHKDSHPLNPHLEPDGFLAYLKANW